MRERHRGRQFNLGRLTKGIHVSQTSRRVAAAAIVCGALLASWWISSLVVWRDGEYRELIQQFQHARPLQRQEGRAGVSTGRWYEVLALETGVEATIDVPDALSPRATVSFSNDPIVYGLYSRKDYTTVISVRVDGESIFVLRNVELFCKTQWLSRFDMKARKLISDRRIDPVDVDEQR
jgi:hypothetical protein